MDDEPLKAAGYLNARLAAAMVATISGYPAKAYPLYQEMLKVDPKHGAAGPNACFVQSLLLPAPQSLALQGHRAMSVRLRPQSTSLRPGATFRAERLP